MYFQPVVDEARTVALNIVEEPTEDVSVSPTPGKSNNYQTLYKKTIHGRVHVGKFSNLDLLIKVLVRAIKIKH